MKTALSVVLLLFTFACFAVAEDGETKTRIHATNEELCRVFSEANDARFDEMFTGKTITVAGKIDSIRRPFDSNHYRVTLQPPGEGVAIRLVFIFSGDDRKSLAGFNRGDEIILRGDCFGADGDSHKAIRFRSAELVVDQVSK